LNLAKSPVHENLLLRTLRRLTPEQFPWVSIYWIFTASSFLMVFWLLFSKFPRVEQTDDERHEHDETAHLPARAGGGYEDEHLGGCLGADAVDHSDTESCSRRVLGEGIIGQRNDMAVQVSMVAQSVAPRRRAAQNDDRFVRPPVLVLNDEIMGIGQPVYMLVLDLDQLARRCLTASEPMGATSRSAQNEHPATTHPKVATMAREGVEDVATQDDEGRPYEPLHDGVDAGGQPFSEDDGGEAEQEHDEGVAERVQRCEPH